MIMLFLAVPFEIVNADRCLLDLVALALVVWLVVGIRGGWRCCSNWAVYSKTTALVYSAAFD